MRIIADKKDYYDCVQAHGQDLSLIYLRKPEEVILDQKQWIFPLVRSWFWHDIDIHIIGFCGKIYPVIEFFDKQVRCFNMDEVDAFAESSLKSVERRIYQSKSKASWRLGRFGHRKDLARFFEECEQKQNSYMAQFMEKLCPIFVATLKGGYKGSVTYNALLKPLEFFRIFDTYSAFQEIEMFMSNMAMPEKPMPVIPDDLKVHSRGFTDQSFRAPFRDAQRVPK